MRGPSHNKGRGPGNRKEGDDLEPTSDKNLSRLTGILSALSLAVSDTDRTCRTKASVSTELL